MVTTVTTVEPADEVLLQEYLAGVPSAGNALVGRHRDRVLQFVRWFAGAEEATAEDITQDIFLQVLRSARSFKGRSSFRTWLFSVARHVCFRHRQLRDRYQGNLSVDDLDHDIQLPTLSPDQLEQLASRDMAAAVRQAADQLPAHLRTVLLMREWEELSYDDIAGVLEIPVGTVRSRLFNARAALLERMEPILKEATPWP